MVALPPYSALRALEAAARLRSYSRAADELFVTHGAVSHQIRGLEQRFGVKLFRREGNEMVPTAAASRLARAVSEASGLLTAGVARLEAEGSPNTLVISTLGGFFRRLLAPRMHRFTEVNPGLEIDIRSEDRLADFVTDGVDLALRYGPGGWPEVRSDLLFRESVFPVCSPEFQRRYALKAPADLLRAPLLRHRDRLWRAWFQRVGIEAGEPKGGLVFDESSALLDAAVAGLGAALARSGLVGFDLESGRLVRPFAEAQEEPWGYFIVWREDSPKQAIIQRFRDWMLEEFAQERAVQT